MLRSPLEGIRIIDLGNAWAGPLASRILADLGAEVIKVESIQIMDQSRGSIKGTWLAGGFISGDPGERPYNRRGVFHQWNRNKLGMTLNLKSTQGVEIFKKLVQISDVVCENSPPRVMKSLGIDYSILKKIKPDLIMISMPAYGSTGPESNYIAYGILQEQMSGGTALTGYLGEGQSPMKSGIDYGDPTAGAAAAALILVALHYRLRTGKGQWIDLSQTETAALLFGEAIMDYVINQRLGKPMGNRHKWMAPHGCYRCKGDDMWVAISVSSDEQWKSFCHIIGNPSWTKEGRFAVPTTRWENQDELDRLIEESTIHYDHYEFMNILQTSGVPAGAVLSAKERVEDPHLKSRGFFLTGRHPEARGIHLSQGPTMKLTKSPITIQKLAPSLGEHNEYILAELLGISKQEIAKLEKEQVIGTIPCPEADRGT